MAKIKIYDEDELETEAAKEKIALGEIKKDKGCKDTEPSVDEKSLAHISEIRYLEAEIDEINDYINDLEEKINAVIKFLSIRYGLELVRTVEDDEIKLSPIFPGA